MEQNCKNMINFQVEFKEAYGDCDNLVLKKWVEKSSSYTNWGDGDNFHLKFLPSQAYFNFINKGYVNQKEILQFPSQPIAHFYQFCIEFSTGLQLLENDIRALKKGRKTAPIAIPLRRFPLKTFQCPQEICKFAIEEFYQFYAEENDFNDGIIGEYKNAIESLKQHEWLIQGGGSMVNIGPILQYLMNGLIVAVGFCLAAIVGGSIGTLDSRLSLQFFGIGFALMALGTSLLLSQGNTSNLAKIKDELVEIKELIKKNNQQ
jgi:hypothetical protein